MTTLYQNKLLKAKELIRQGKLILMDIQENWELNSLIADIFIIENRILDTVRENDVPYESTFNTQGQENHSGEKISTSLPPLFSPPAPENKQEVGK